MSRSKRDKIFICPYPGCKKAYTRKEYVRRHFMNHHKGEIASSEIPFIYHNWEPAQRQTNRLYEDYTTKRMMSIEALLCANDKDDAQLTSDEFPKFEVLVNGEGQGSPKPCERPKETKRVEENLDLDFITSLAPELFRAGTCRDSMSPKYNNVLRPQKRMARKSINWS